MPNQFFNEKLLDFRESFLMTGGIVLVFVGLAFLKIYGAALSHEMLSPVLLGSAILLIISGTFKITHIISNMKDAYLFAFFRKMESIHIFVKNGGFISVVITTFVITISLLGFLISRTFEQSLLGALVFSSFFPFLVLMIRMHNRVKIYRNLSDDVEKHGF